MSNAFSNGESKDEETNRSNDHDHLQVLHEEDGGEKEQTFAPCDNVNIKNNADGDCPGQACECGNNINEDDHQCRSRSRLNTLSSKRSFRLTCSGDNGDHLGIKRMSPPPRHPSIILHRTDHRRSLTENEDVDGYDARDMSFKWYEQLAIIFSICTFLGDIGTDILVASIHYLNEDYWYMALTLAFVFIPTLVMTGISLRWYILDAREETSPEVSTTTWILRVVLLLFQLGPILRYIDSFRYGMRFKKHKHPKDKKKYYTYMVYEDTDAAFLRLFECYMEAAPQLVLQLYIFAKKAAEGPKNPEEPPDNVWTVLTQIATILTSLVSVSWSLVSYNRALRMCMEDKANLNWKGIAAQFLWRFFVIAARVLALAFFASVFRFYISVVCGLHWLLMLCWIRWMRTSFCDNPVEEFGYNAILACMFIFCYFNPVDSPTRYRYTAFYLFMFCENSILMALWFFHRSTQFLWYHIPGLVGHYASFFTGLVFMAIYYLIFHPSQNIKLCRRGASHDSNEGTEETSLKAGSASGQSSVQSAKKPQGGYKLQIENGDTQKIWTTQGRILHPRPAQPVMDSSSRMSAQEKVTPDSTKKDKKKGAKSSKEAVAMFISDRDLNKSSTDPQLALTSNHEISLSSTSCNNFDGHQMKDIRISFTPSSDSGRTMMASKSETNTSSPCGVNSSNAATHHILSPAAGKSASNGDAKAPVTCV